MTNRIFTNVCDLCDFVMGDRFAFQDQHQPIPPYHMMGMHLQCLQLRYLFI